MNNTFFLRAGASALLPETAHDMRSASPPR